MKLCKVDEKAFTKRFNVCVKHLKWQYVIGIESDSAKTVLKDWLKKWFDITSLKFLEKPNFMDIFVRYLVTFSYCKAGDGTENKFYLFDAQTKEEIHGLKDILSYLAASANS